MIVFEDVAKRYAGGYTALAGVSFEIRHGELVVLTGHSGAGKSTLFKLIPVIERPTAGRVLINGQDVSHLPKTAIPYLRRNLGLVFQDQKLLFDRSVFDNVMLPLSITGFPAAEAKRRVQAALDKVGLLAREKAMPIMLSGGEQQRLAIARAVVGRPNLLLADEPTAHLDAATAADVARVFLEFREVGVTVLIATYDDRLFGAPRRLTLDHGRLAA